jgi:hypothetical protein
MQLNSWMILAGKKGANMLNLTQLSDTAIINALFAIAVIEADEYGELTWQDERDYQALNWELDERLGRMGDRGCNGRSH